LQYLPPYTGDRRIQPSAKGTAAEADAGYDFTVLDQLLPHPVYAPQSWVCVLNPSAETFERLRPLPAEAYGRVARRTKAEVIRQHRSQLS
jgi:hypothetical protein